MNYEEEEYREDRYNGENSDFEDDVVEIDFEEEIEKDELKRAQQIDNSVGSFGEEDGPKEDDDYDESEDDDIQEGMDIPAEFAEEVASLCPDEEAANQADIYDVIEEGEDYPDGLTAEDISPQLNMPLHSSGGHAENDDSSLEPSNASKIVEDTYNNEN